MAVERPTIDRYPSWLREKFKCDDREHLATRYDAVAVALKQAAENAPFLIELLTDLNRYDQEYLTKTGYPLFPGGFKPSIVAKPFASFLLKTYRLNILENHHWPDAPLQGWILPEVWFSKINDIVRTLFVAKYLDGVEFLIEKIRTVCGAQNVNCDVVLEAREEGYYAAHLYIRHRCAIPGPTWDTATIDACLEVQITTQLQEVIRQVSHKYYEERRIRQRDRSAKWQWDYKSEEFVPNYLGHLLHYLEGMIMDVRERQRRTGL